MRTGRLDWAGSGGLGYRQRGKTRGQWRVPSEPRLTVEVKFFDRHKSGALRDGVLLSVEQRSTASRAPWSYDSDGVTVSVR